MASEKDLKVGVHIDASATGLDQIDRTRAGIASVGDAAEHASGRAAGLGDGLAAGAAHADAATADATRSTARLAAALDDLVQASRDASTATTSAAKAAAAAADQTDRLTKAADDAAKAAGRHAESANLLRDALGLIGGGAVANEFVAANARAESLGRTLRQLTGDAGKAASEQQYLSEMAQRLGVALADVSGSYIELTAAAKGTSIEGVGVRDIFESIAGAMSSLGKSGSETENAVRAISQMLTATRVKSEELKGQLGEALPGALKAAADALGVTTEQLNVMLESGTILTDQFLPLFARQVRTQFGLSQAPVQGLTADINRMKNEWEQTLIAVGRAGGTDAVAQVLHGAASAAAVAGSAFVFLGKSVGNAVANIGNSAEYTANQKELVAQLGAVWNSATGAVDKHAAAQASASAAINVGTEASLRAAVAAARAAHQYGLSAEQITVLRTQLQLADAAYEQYGQRLAALDQAEQSAVTAAVALAAANGDEADQARAAVIAAQQQISALERRRNVQEAALVIAERDLTLAQKQLAQKAVVTQADTEMVAAAYRRVAAAQATIAATDGETIAAQALLAQKTREATLRREGIADAERETQTSQASANAKVVEAQAAIDIARAKGREGDARRAIIQLARAEADLADAVAAGKRTEADAAEQAAASFRREAAARGDLSAKARDEQLQLDQSAIQRRAEADAAGATADAKRAAADAAQRSAQATGADTAATRDNTQALIVQQQQAVSTASAAEVLAENMRAARAAVYGLSTAAGLAFDALRTAHVGMRELFPQQTRDNIDLMKGGIEALEVQLRRANSTLAGLHDYLQFESLGWRAYTEYFVDATEVTRQYYQTALDVARAQAAMDRAMERGGVSASQLAQATALAGNAAKYLDEQQLSELTASIERARAAVQSLNDDLARSVEQLREQNAQLRGDEAGAERLRHEAAVVELQEKAAKARASGDRQAVAAAAEALRLTDENYQLTLEQIKARASQSQTTPTYSPPAADSVPANSSARRSLGAQTLRVELAGPGGQLAQLDVAGTADQVMGQLAKLGRVR